MVGKYFVIDAHCHIYPDKIAERAVQGTSRFYYNKPFEGTGTVNDLMQRGSDAGIDMFMVQSVATTPRQVKSINEFIAASVAASNGKLIGLGTLHPDSDDQVRDVEHLISLGLRGVKLHPDIQAFKMDDYRCLRIYELCEEHHLPILMHTGDNRYDYSNPNRLKPILQIYNDLTVIGAHFGGWSIWEEASIELCSYPNLYVDCSSSMPCISKATAKEIVERYGAQRIMFGTDYPMWSPHDEIENLLSLGLTEEQNQMIFSGTAKKLFGISHS